MTVSHFRTLFAYNKWAADRILAQVLTLSDGEFQSPIVAALGHAVGAEVNMLARAQGASPSTMLNAGDFPTPASLKDRWDAQHEARARYLATLSDGDIDSAVTYTTMRGDTYTQPRSLMLAHAINHSTQHRSEAAWVLTELGHSPGDLDLIVYLREHTRPAGG